jgi:Bifunctional DNA primase/polymerase, N-terminal/Primase C terminal 2 (PriCT-2)
MTRLMRPILIPPANHNFMLQHADRLIDHGFKIVPIMPRTKKPGLYTSDGRWINFPNWNACDISPTGIETWKTWRGAGIGIVCGNVCAIDIDVLDESAGQAVADSIIRDLGNTDGIRIGRWPKRLLVYRTDAPFHKITMSRIECLCQGQQFVAYGIHPDTGQPYYWPLESIANIAVDDLPTVTAEQVRRALDKTLPLFFEEMRSLRTAGRNVEPHTANHELVETPQGLAAAVAAIPNDNLHWVEWDRVGKAIYGASGGSDEGFAMFDNFFMKSIKYHHDETLHRWRGYRRSPPGRLGFEILFHLAKENGWAPGPDINNSCECCGVRRPVASGNDRRNCRCRRRTTRPAINATRWL